MMVFSEREFGIMVEELLYREKPKFDMLCCIADKSLSKQVKRWCNSDFAIGGKNHEIDQDIMQEIYIKLIQKTVPDFLLRNGADGEVNYDPEGFNKWMFTIAKRETFGYLKKNKMKATAALYDKEGKTIDIPGGENPEDMVDSDVTKDEIKKSFDIVWNADIRIYKVLTWLTVSLVMLNYDVSKIKSTEIFVNEIKGKTLFEIRNLVYLYSENLDWLKVTEKDKQRIESALDDAFDDSRIWGEVRLEECLMKKGDKNTVSDWINRINNMIKRSVAAE